MQQSVPFQFVPFKVRGVSQSPKFLFGFSFLGHSGSGGGLSALRPASLIFGDTVATPSIASPLRSGNLSWKRRQGSRSGWGPGSRLATKPDARHRKWQLSRAVMPKRRRRGPPTDGRDCLRTLSHALDPPGHQNKCRQASMSS